MNWKKTPAMVEPTANLSNKIVFIIGLHRSGTTLLADILSGNPNVSAFKNTGFPKDEGQFLQTVFPRGHQFGGPGKFGFAKESHLTEACSLCTAENGRKLLDEWGKYWDFDKDFLLEKSPPNILKTRFLSKLFPEAYFIVLTRHPIAVSLATQKWSKSSVFSLLKHWVRCHRLLYSDLMRVDRTLFLKYEQLIADPEGEIKRVGKFIGLNSLNVDSSLVKDSNEFYFEKWCVRPSIRSKVYRSFLELYFDGRLKEFGYSMYLDAYNCNRLPK